MSDDIILLKIFISSLLMKNVLRHGREKKYLYPTVAMCVETLRYLPIFILPYDLKVWLAKVRQI